MSGPDSTVWQDSTLARTYLEGVRGAIPLAAEQIEIMVRLSREIERPVRRILDIGCGNGILAAALLDAHPLAEAVLTDFSPTMLEAARDRFAARNDNVAILDADYSHASWLEKLPPGAFDVVVSGYSIHHQPDERKRAVYREIFDLLAPGGLFVNIEHVSSATPWVQSLGDEYLVDAFHAHQTRLGTGKARSEVARECVYREDKSANLLSPVDEQCDWLRGIGFEDVDCFLKIFELAVFGGRKVV